MLVNIHSVSNRTAFVNRDIVYIAMTRFNVALPRTAGAVEIRARGAMAEWTARRVEIFRSWCLVPMLKQRIKPHAWVILFDQDVTPPIADVLEDLVDYDWIVPLLVGENWAKPAADETREVLRIRFGNQDPKFICCTRLDNDDSLNTLFHVATDAAVERLRNSWTADTSVCINFPFGAMQHNGSLMIRLKEKHFFALVEPFETFRGPYRFNHTKVDQHYSVVDVLTEQPMYIHQRHEQNTGGQLKNVSFEEFANRQRVLSHFGLEEPPGASATDTAVARDDLVERARAYAGVGVGGARAIGAALRTLPAVTGVRTRFQRAGRESATGHVLSDAARRDRKTGS